MSIFRTLLQFSLFLDTEEDYKIWIMALYKLCKNNTEIETLKPIAQVVECALDTAYRTGQFKNYFSRELGKHFQQVATEELNV